MDAEVFGGKSFFTTEFTEFTEVDTIVEMAETPKSMPRPCMVLEWLWSLPEVSFHTVPQYLDIEMDQQSTGIRARFM